MCYISQLFSHDPLKHGHSIALAEGLGKVFLLSVQRIEVAGGEGVEENTNFVENRDQGARAPDTGSACEGYRATDVADRFERARALPNMYIKRLGAAPCSPCV